MMRERLCVVMPVYNEQDAIGTVLRKWAQTLDGLGIDYALRPYDDGSTDGSLGVMRDCEKALPRVDVREKRNGGHGQTVLTGYREAVADGFDWIFQVDSDDEMGPESFGGLWLRRADYEFLVGCRDGRVQPLSRGLVSLASRWCVRICFGRQTVRDVNAPYRLMRVDAFRDVYGRIPLSTFAPNLIVSGLVARMGLRFFEVRVPWRERTTGEVSIRKWKLFRASVLSFWQTVRFALCTKGE